MNEKEDLEVLCGYALTAHYTDKPWQTFHHAPSVAMVVLDAVPDGWAKIAGQWTRLAESRPFAKAEHGRGCWFRAGGPCDCTANTALMYRPVRS